MFNPASVDIQLAGIGQESRYVAATNHRPHGVLSVGHKASVCLPAMSYRKERIKAGTVFALVM